MSTLLQARTVAAADSALAGLKGGVGQLVASVRAQAVALLAEIEVRFTCEHPRAVPRAGVRARCGRAGRTHPAMADESRCAVAFCSCCPPAAGAVGL